MVPERDIPSMIQKNDLEYLIRHLARNNVVLFLGAGFSASATNQYDSPVPLSRDLAVALWTYLQYPGEHDGTTLGILYQAALTHVGGRAPLIELLTNLLTIRTYPDWYLLTTRWFWFRIYTINVDNLVERIYSTARAELDVIIAPSEYHDRDAFLRRISLIKLHGSIDHPEQGLVFSPRDYGRRASEQDVWYDHFVRDFSTKPTLFVGTELDEPLFWQYIALRQRRAGKGEKRPKSFLVCPSVSIAKEEVLSEFNVVTIKETAQTFLEMLARQPDSSFSRETVLRNLDPSLAVIQNLVETGTRSADVQAAEKFLAIFRPVTVGDAVKSGRSHFLLGSPPTWNDIHARLDADRDINCEIRAAIRQHMTGNPDVTPVVVLSGPAGSGKTTIAKRVATEVAADGFSVYYQENERRPLAQDIVSYLEMLNRRVLLVFDEAADDLHYIRDLIDACEHLRQRPVIFLTSRTNDLATKRYVLHGLPNISELKVPDLSDGDIRSILEKLEQQGLLGKLRPLSDNERFNIFKLKAKKQILVAMREATRGKGFDEIIQDEFNEIQPHQAKLLYLVAAIPSAHRYTIQRGQLIAAAELPPNETSVLVDDNLSGVLIPYEGDPDRLQARHPVIAEHVITEVAPRIELAHAYTLYLEILSHDLSRPSERRRSRAFKIYRDLINHRRLHVVFVRQPELCRDIYESIRRHFINDGHYWLQYGSYELEYGDLDFAENYLMQAEALMPNHPWVTTSLGYLLMRRAVEAHSLMAAQELIALGLEKIRQQILVVGSEDPYPYHVLGSQMLSYIRQWVPSRNQARDLNSLHTEVSEGQKKHPLDTKLRSLADEIKKAELQKATGAE